MQEKQAATNGGMNPMLLLTSLIMGSKSKQHSPIIKKRHNPYINQTLHSLDGAVYAFGRGGSLIRTKRRDGDNRTTNRNMIHNKRVGIKHNHHKGI